MSIDSVSTSSTVRVADLQQQLVSDQRTLASHHQAARELQQALADDQNRVAQDHAAIARSRLSSTGSTVDQYL